jgi:3-demethoxyubiquinol 3-hydroxylase
MPTASNPADQLINAADGALRTLFAPTHAARACPTLPDQATELTEAERSHAGALMRINHVGEVCAQALYAAQGIATKDESLKAHFQVASKEEADHLAWTKARLDELGARPSLLNPLWYAGAFALGLVAGRLGDKISLGFVEETEAQVQHHLEGHLLQLPEGDHASRAIVAQMRDDEARHGKEARTLGAQDLPLPVKALMRSAAKVMTTVAYRI